MGLLIGQHSVGCWGFGGNTHFNVQYFKASYLLLEVLYIIIRITMGLEQLHRNRRWYFLFFKSLKTCLCLSLSCRWRLFTMTKSHCDSISASHLWGSCRACMGFSPGIPASSHILKHQRWVYLCVQCKFSAKRSRNVRMAGVFFSFGNLVTSADRGGCLQCCALLWERTQQTPSQLKWLRAYSL